MTPGSSADNAIGAALRGLPLKEMDPSLLTFAILRESADLRVDGGALRTAMELAAFLHRNDVRGARRHLADDVYVTHPFRLVLRLVRWGCIDLAVLCAAALHDTVEDHPDDVVALLRDPAQAHEGDAIDLLATAFGDDVAGIVAAVTNPPPTSNSEEDRHRAYRDHVANVIADGQVFLVKIADYVDNAGSLRHMVDPERRARLARKYAPLVPTFRTALAEHGEKLPLGSDGPGQIAQHLDTIEEWFAG